MSKIAIVAALEAEVRPLVRAWPRLKVTPDFAFYETSNAVLVCGGIGPAAASKAAQAILNYSGAQVLVSTGFAGALNPVLKTGEVVMPAHVLDGASGRSYETGDGSGVLLSTTSVANPESKRDLRTRFGADAVDMEAGAVAGVASDRGIRFIALKAISDESDFALPVSDRFVDEVGGFRTAAFVTNVLVRPWLWGRAFRLASNCAIAARTLAHALDTLVRDGTPEQLTALNLVRSFST